MVEAVDTAAVTILPPCHPANTLRGNGLIEYYRTSTL
jgi:hypothetical protein